MYCKNCGKEIDDRASFCPHCKTTVVREQTSDDQSSFGFAFLSFLFPLIGLILFIVWNTSSPLKAKSCGKGALAGFITSVLLGVILGIGYSCVVASILSANIAI